MPKLHYKEQLSDQDSKRFAPYLSEDEELILATGFGKTYLRQRFIVQLILPGGVFILGGVVFAYVYKINLGYGMLVGLLIAAFFSVLKTLLTYHANRYLLTTRRVIIKKGFFAVKLTSALYDKITHIEVDQSFLEKVIMHHGTIIINTAGMNKGEIILRFVDYPIELKNLLERLINREREHFGLRGGVLEAVEGELV